MATDLADPLTPRRQPPQTPKINFSYVAFAHSPDIAIHGHWII